MKPAIVGLACLLACISPWANSAPRQTKTPYSAPALAARASSEESLAHFRKNLEAAGFLPKYVSEPWRSILFKDFYTDDDFATITPRAGALGLIVAARVDYLFNQGRWYFLASGQREPRPLAQDEFTRFRNQRLLPALDLTRAIKLVYGKGSRKIIVFSAIDCPHCLTMEDELRNASDKLDATLYLFPATLRSDNAQAVAAVQDLWCSPNNARAWKDYWRTRTLPPRQAACGLGNRHTHLLLRALQGTGFPNALLEDGTLLFAGDGNWVKTFSQAAPAKPVWE